MLKTNIMYNHHSRHKECLHRQCNNIVAQMGNFGESIIRTVLCLTVFAAITGEVLIEECR